jgi:hypothetical protein
MDFTTYHWQIYCLEFSIKQMMKSLQAAYKTDFANQYQKSKKQTVFFEYKSSFMKSLA